MAGPQMDDDGSVVRTGHATRVRIDDLTAVRRNLVRLFIDVKAGRLTALEANRTAKLLVAIGETMKAEALEKRVRALEERVVTRR